MTKKPYLIRLNSSWVISLALILLVTGCVPVRKMEYLKENTQKDSYSYDKAALKPDLIEPKDVISITVTSSEQSDRNFLQNDAPMANITQEGMALVAYTVDLEGYVHLPIIGAVKIAGLSEYEAAEKLNEAMMGYINQPIINLRKVNRRVIVLGEVRLPGTYIYTKVDMNVFDALSLAGDITDFGNRKHVMLIRQEGDKIVKKQLNLRDPNFVTTTEYFIEEDDILFVKPLAAKRFDMIYDPLSLIMSTLTSLIVVSTYFQQTP